MKVSTPRVFLSYAADDKEVAQQLAQALRDHALEVWTADSEIAAGENWAAQIADALDRSDAMVVLLTRKSVRSASVRRDIEYALSARRFAHRLIPVVIGERASWLGKVPWVLKRLHMVASPSAAQASKRVAQALKKAG